MGVVVRLIINAAAIWVATLVLPGLSLVPEDGGEAVLVALVVSLVLGLVSALVRPVAMLLSLPLVVLTLGLFTVLVNGAMLALTAWVTELTDYGLRIDSFAEAVLGGLVISVVSVLLSMLVVSAFERGARDRPTHTA